MFRISPVFSLPAIHSSMPSPFSFSQVAVSVSICIR